MPEVILEWLFAGSDRVDSAPTVMFSLIATAKMDDIDPQAWLADVLARIAEDLRQKGLTTCCRGTGGRNFFSLTWG